MPPMLMTAAVMRTRTVPKGTSVSSAKVQSIPTPATACNERKSLLKQHCKGILNGGIGHICLSFFNHCCLKREFCS